MPEKLSKVAVRIRSEDNVATAIIELEKGTEIENGRIILTLKSDIPAGHKFALTSVPRSSEIIKYGEVIGATMSDVSAGDWVHVHNLEGRRGRGDLRKLSKG